MSKCDTYQLPVVPVSYWMGGVGLLVTSIENQLIKSFGDSLIIRCKMKYLYLFIFFSIKAFFFLNLFKYVLKKDSS